MLMVIFGAGASHDSSPRFLTSNWSSDDIGLAVGQARPPLANKLFDEVLYADCMGRHAQGAALFERLRKVATDKTTSIEQVLEEISQESERYPHIARQMLVLRYNLRDIISNSTTGWTNLTNHVTNYAALLDEVESWRYDNNQPLLLITFNYDTLLDEACKNVLSLQSSDMASYVANPFYKLFRVHGSASWARLVGNVKGRVLDSVGQLEWTSVYVPRGNASSQQSRDHVPAIAVPTLSKGGFECPQITLKC